MDYSFIVPVYNCKTYLANCVESVLAVQVPSFEILLVDDGSEDGSGVVCDELAEKYGEIRVIHQKNFGVSAARNRGIKEARGGKILFLDADDTMDSTALGEILTDPRCDQSDLTIFGLTFDYYYKGKCYRRDSLFFEHEGVMQEENWLAAFEALYRKNAISPVWNKVFKREILCKFDLELNADMFLYEDFEFVLRYMRHCDKIWNVPRAVYHYRQSEDEGNAGRRLARIGCLSEFLRPIESAMDDLTGVPPAQRASVLVQLYQVLAREKISVSAMEDIRGICRDYAGWYRGRRFPEEEGTLHRQLMDGRAAALWLQSKKTALRHKIAVWAKSHNLYK